MADTCTHLDTVDPEVAPRSPGCEECLAAGGTWVHLRLCMQCGHVGCCDQSPGRHGTGHFQDAGHPIIQSFEPGEDWWWCFVDEVVFTVPDLPLYAHD
jgi:uncharacterized UBP type Zn finger protein